MDNCSKANEHHTTKWALGERPTIALAMVDTGHAWTRAVWRGAMDAAREQEVNLICFPGRLLDLEARPFDAQANVIYWLLSADYIDGLIDYVPTTLWRFVPGIYHDLTARAVAVGGPRHAPIVNVEREMEGFTSILKDDYGMMRQVVTHLVEVHNCRRLAFVGNVDLRPWFGERYRAYVDVLREHDLVVDPALFCNSFEEQEIVSWLDGLDFSDLDAVVGGNDGPALLVQRLLQARGAHVPRDVAVTGFDDVAEGSAGIPALTTVRVPFYEMGQQAVAAVLATLRGEQVAERYVLPGRLIVRESCDCLPTVVVDADTKIGADSNAAPTLSELRGPVLAVLEEAVRAVGEEPAGDWAERLWEAIVARIKGDESRAFLDELGGGLRWVAEVGGDVGVWHGALSALRAQVLPYLAAGDRVRAENLFQQGQALIGEHVRRQGQVRVLEAERQADLLREISNQVATTSSMIGLQDVLSTGLPRLGILGCYISLYEGAEVPAETSRLIVAYNQEGPVKLEKDGQVFPSHQLVPEGLLSRKTPFYLVVEALYFGKKQLGFAVFEAGPQDGSIYETLQKQLSSALEGVMLSVHNIELYNQARQAQLVAEKADQLKTRLLANVSHELRTPLNIILGYTQFALNSPNPYGDVLSPALVDDLEYIHHNANHLLRLINDLLDLSRAEIDELDLYPELVDTRSFLEGVFRSIANTATDQEEVIWRQRLSARLPLIQADPVRLRQVLLNLLHNAHKFTEKGHIELGAEVSPPNLHIWVQDTGEGIPPDLKEQIFEPFVTYPGASRRQEGIGLGLSISRRLVVLHGGMMQVESEPGRGSTFHIYLPLPSLDEQPTLSATLTQPVLLVISTKEELSPEIIELCRRQGLTIHTLQASDDVETVSTKVRPAALAWDFVGAGAEDWQLIRRLRDHPMLCQLPLILYRQETEDDLTSNVGLTNVVNKPVSGQTLLEAIGALQSLDAMAPILIVDDEAQAREYYQGVVAKGCPGYPIRVAGDGSAALAMMAEETPGLVILDLMMPELDGFQVLEWMRTNEPTRRVPVLILSGRVLTFDDIKRLEQHALVTVQSKGILSDEEVAAMLDRVMAGTDTLPAYTSALVKRAVAYFHQHFHHPLSRQEIVKAIGVSERYFSQIFHQELGLTPWDYLTRYRIQQAKTLLLDSSDSITTVAQQVGYDDPSYFGRVFRKHVGLSPNAYRKEHPR